MTATLPLVSIIVPSYNQGHFLEATLASLFAQDYPRLEVILVDGGSTDNSLEVIQRHAGRLTWWVSEKDKGHADALNKGFARATGEILAWLNSDDIYHPGAIQSAVDALLANPAVSMVYGDAALTDDTGARVGSFAARQTDYARLLRGSVHIPQAATFFRADCFRRVGPLSTTLYYAFDYDLWVRLAKIAPILYIPQLWADFRLHAAGKSVKDDDRCYPDMIRIVQRETGGHAWQMRARHQLRKRLYAWLPWRIRARLRKAVTVK